eukprot:403363840
MKNSRRPLGLSLDIRQAEKIFEDESTQQETKSFIEVKSHDISFKCSLNKLEESKTDLSQEDSQVQLISNSAHDHAFARQTADLSQIDANIYVSNYKTAQSHNFLKKVGITHVINLIGHKNTKANNEISEIQNKIISVSCFSNTQKSNLSPSTVSNKSHKSKDIKPLTSPNLSSKNRNYGASTKIFSPFINSQGVIRNGSHKMGSFEYSNQKDDGNSVNQSLYNNKLQQNGSSPLPKFKQLNKTLISSGSKIKQVKKQDCNIGLPISHTQKKINLKSKHNKTISLGNNSQIYNNLNERCVTSPLSNLSDPSVSLQIQDIMINKPQSVYAQHTLNSETKEIEYLNLSMRDQADCDIKFFVYCSLDFIKKAIKQSNGDAKILIHCQQGNSRSAAIVASYLMFEKNMTDRQALEFLRTKRASIDPNLGFVGQLMVFNKNLQNLQQNMKFQNKSSNIKHQNPTQNKKLPLMPKTSVKYSGNSKFMSTKDVRGSLNLQRSNTCYEVNDAKDFISPKIYKFCLKQKKIICKNVEALTHPTNFQQILQKHGPVSLLVTSKFNIISCHQSLESQDKHGLIKMGLTYLLMLAQLLNKYEDKSQICYIIKSVQGGDNTDINDLSAEKVSMSKIEDIRKLELNLPDPTIINEYSPQSSRNISPIKNTRNLVQQNINGDSLSLKLAPSQPVHKKSLTSIRGPVNLLRKSAPQQGKLEIGKISNNISKLLTSKPVEIGQVNVSLKNDFNKRGKKNLKVNHQPKTSTITNISFINNTEQPYQDEIFDSTKMFQPQSLHLINLNLNKSNADNHQMQSQQQQIIIDINESISQDQFQQPNLTVRNLCSPGI